MCIIIAEPGKKLSTFEPLFLINTKSKMQNLCITYEIELNPLRP